MSIVILWHQQGPDMTMAVWKREWKVEKHTKRIKSGHEATTDAFLPSTEQFTRTLPFIFSQEAKAQKGLHELKYKLGEI